ncbi:TetR/AcrR family transcriptional regulator [Mycoplasmatota bacterium WC30]
MPVALSSKERSIIKKKLQVAAENSLMKFGAKKTTVDNLVKSVNIPKGTFYLFYPSKDMLLYEVFQIKHDELQHEFVKRVLEIKDDLSPSKVTNLIFDVYKKLDSTFLMSFMTSGDLELVISKLPLEVIQKHIEGDEISMEKILSIIPNVNEEMNEVYSAALRLVMTSVLHKKEIGVEYYEEALKLSIRGIINQIFEDIII